MWTFLIALAGIWVTIEIGKQLYTAATQGYILTGHSMNRKVYRAENPALFRNNLIANIVMLPVVGCGSGLLVARAVGVLFP